MNQADALNVVWKSYASGNRKFSSAELQIDTSVFNNLIKQGHIRESDGVLLKPPSQEAIEILKGGSFLRKNKTKIKDVDFSEASSLCSICGNNRQTGGHPRCSKIKQQKYRAENE